MNGRRARHQRQQKRARLEELAKGATPTRSELIDALKLKRDARLADENRQYVERLRQLQQDLADAKKAVWGEWEKSRQAINHAHAAQSTGIVIAGADTDVGKVADELAALTKGPV